MPLEDISHLQSASQRFLSTKNAAQAASENLAQISSQYTRISGEFMLNGSGEVIVPVEFPNDIAFIDKPLFSFGGEMRDWNASLEAGLVGKGQFPTVSAMVVGWTMRDNAIDNTRLYMGCRLAVVTGGWSTQKVFIHWHMEGVALGGPSSYEPVPFIGS